MKKTPFELLLFKAARKGGDPTPVLDYLIGHGPLTLTQEERSTLAWFLSKKLPRAAHRPRHSLNTKTLAVDCAAYLVRIGKEEWCYAHKTKKATKATPLASLVALAVELVEAQLDIAGQIDPYKVTERQLLKPTRAAIEFVREDMPGAIEHICAEALR